MKRILRDLLAGESGQDLIEYALLASLIAAVSVAAMNVLGPVINTYYERVNDNFPGG